ncbi:hypothetical protein ABW20_dc0106531 [Dactylellina cionopaga]|nr:hypothetical protein ABW20_dc0106531 [Dactylellina cionopaga]
MVSSMADVARLIAEKDPDVRLDIYKDFLYRLSITEELCNKTRRAMGTNLGLGSFLSKMKLVSGNYYNSLYSLGVSTCLGIEDYYTAWKWIQKAKGRSFSDILGIRELETKEYVEEIFGDPALQTLLLEERQLMEQTNTATDVEALIKEQELMQCRQRMRESPGLSTLMAIREGVFEEIDWLFSNPTLRWLGDTRRCIFIDWFIPKTKGSDVIICTARTSDGRLFAIETPISVTKVNDWIEKNLAVPEHDILPIADKKSGNKRLWELNGLLCDLEKVVNEDDLLILCPAAPLHRIPLHGLQLFGRRILADTNLVIFSSSLAVHRQCLARAFEKTEAMDVVEGAEKNTRWHFFGVYQETEEKKAAEKDRIYEHIETLASYHSAGVSLDLDATPENFTSLAAEADLVHYHGHGHLNSSHVIEQGLILSSGKEKSKEQSEITSHISPAHSVLSIANIFRSKLGRRGFHLTMIACNSGVQDLKVGDEPLGLINSFLYSGASSVIGCLWAIPSRAGRSFSEKFYEALASTNMEERGYRTPQNVLNIAEAYRQAIRKMKDDKSTSVPYYWASFVLHGSWFTFGTQKSASGL